MSVVAFWREAAPEWADAQARVRAIVSDRLGAERGADVPEGLQQIWIEDEWVVETDGLRRLAPAPYFDIDDKDLATTK